MISLLLGVGRVAGVAGALVCLAAIVIRMTGQFWVAGYQTGTLLLAGSAAMIGGCFCLLWALTEQRRIG